MTKAEHARAFRAQRKAEGICLDCNAPSEAGKSRCSIHLAKLSEAAKARRNPLQKAPTKPGRPRNGKIKFWARILPETQRKILAAKQGKETPGEVLDRLI